MSEIRIETLTPVHIGSGNVLQNNTDFVVYKDGDDKFIYIIDERKIINLIGEDNIDQWLATIQNKDSVLNLISRYSPKSRPRDFSNQTITCYAYNIKSNDTLKEIIHNGMGLPYIPGSSIKGAIRTAILAVLSENTTDIEKKVVTTNKWNKTIISAESIEKELFGNNPNNDIFRFIRVGDAHFEKECTIATRMINLNIRDNNSLIDKSKPQIVQAISPKEESTFNITIAKDYHSWAKSKSHSIGDMPSEISSLYSLFMLINEHTKELVESEINYWKELDFDDGKDYIKEMEHILKYIERCEKGKSCILRIGHGSGWRFITGAWAERLSNFNQSIVPATRPMNQKYQQYDFPKSRRIDEDSDIFGFVKLSLL